MSTYNVSVDTWRNRLSYVGYSVLTYGYQSCRIGGNGRGQGYVEETYARATDGSQTDYLSTVIQGSTIDSASFRMDITAWDGIRPGAFSVGLFAQKRKAFSGLTTPPRYDDFDTGLAWGSGAEGAALSTASVPAAGSGRVTFPSTPALVALVQAWKNGTQDSRQGFVIAAADTGYFGYYTEFGNLYLDITSSDPSSSSAIFRRRRTESGLYIA